MPGQAPLPSDMHTILCLLAIMLLGGAFPAVADSGPATGAAYYTGPVSAARNREFFAALAGAKVTRLIITSAGGEVEAGIALGTWVHEHGIDVEVPEYCLSSCANYVFPAGRRKLIRPGAVVAWHGNYTHLVQTGLWEDDIAARMERHGEHFAVARRRAREEAERLAQLERGFFARIGVDEYLCQVGKRPPWSVPNYYFLSARDMARFGVSDVTVPPDYAQTDVSGLGPHVVYIELEPEAGPVSRKRE